MLHRNATKMFIDAENRSVHVAKRRILNPIQRAGGSAERAVRCRSQCIVPESCLAGTSVRDGEWAILELVSNCGRPRALQGELRSTFHFHWPAVASPVPDPRLER